MTELDHPILIEHKVTGPCIAEIIAPDLVLVIDNDRILDALLGYGFFDLAHIFLVFDPRRVHTDNDQAILSVLVVKLLDVRHRFRAKRTVPRPEIDQYNFAAKLFKFQRCRVDPGVSALQFRRLLTNENVIRMLCPRDGRCD